MNEESSGKKVNKFEILLTINRSIMNDDMEKMFQAISTYMYYSGQTVTRKTITRFSEDGLITESDSSQVEQWLYKKPGKDDEG